jgi:hypothetical protein
VSDKILQLKNPYLIMYGTVDSKRHTKADQIRYRPEPKERSIPRGIEVLINTKSLIDSAFFRATVHIAAPTSRRKLPSTARDDETKKATVCLTRPLRENVVQHDR